MNLRDYQSQAIQAVREGFRTTGKKQVLMLPTGSGKTHIASYMIQQASSRGLKCLFVCDRIELINQTSERFFKDNIDHGVIQASHPYFFPELPVQVCSIQTLARRKIMNFDLLVIDECFVGSTIISTPNGDKTIDSLQCGDEVYNQIGTGTVKKVFCRSVSETYKVRFTDGTETECTGSHKFFTTEGWKEARLLEVGQVAFGLEGMRMVWEDVHPMEEHRQGWERGRLLGKDLEIARMLLDIVCEEIEEPDEQPQRETKGEQAAERNATSTYKARRERALASFATVGPPSCSRGRVGGRGGCGHRDEGGWARLSNLLQNGHCPQRENDRGGNRWCESYYGDKKRTRPEEDGLFGIKRVESVSIVERGGNKTVYNLHVSGHPSYFANGVAVHNCHALHQAHINLMRANDGHVVGLSATPFAKGMGKHFDGMVHPVSTRFLIDQGYLADFEAYGPKTIDVSGIKTVAGDFDPQELGERADKPKLVADIVETWLKLGKGRQTICFATNRAHSRHLVREFQKHRVSADHIDCYTGKLAEDESRADVIGRFKSGETTVLCNVDILTKGFDYPEVSCIIQARPTKSLMVHIQQVGRGLRVADGKTQCLILDHAGNHERLGFVDAQLPTVLDDGKKKAGKSDKKKADEKDEPLPKRCPSCDFLKPAGVRKCPACGLIPSFAEDVETDEGELEKLSKSARKEYTVAAKQEFLSGLNQWCRDRGWTPGRKGCFGTALKMYKNKFGTEPPSGIEWGAVGPITDDVKNFITHSIIRRNKQREKAEAQCGLQG